MKRLQANAAAQLYQACLTLLNPISQPQLYLQQEQAALALIQNLPCFPRVSAKSRQRQTLPEFVNVSVQPCCSSAVTSAVPVNDPNNNSADENNTNSAFQHCCSSVITYVVPVNDPNDNSAGKINANPAETVSLSPTKRQQVADQKPKPSRNRYDTAPVTLPNDALLSRSPHRHNPDAARGVLVDQTHFQQVPDTTEFKDVRKNHYATCRARQSSKPAICLTFCGPVLQSESP